MGEIKNCRPYLARQLEQVRPELLVCLGSLAWRAFLLLQEADSPGFCERELGIPTPAKVKLPDVVGRCFVWRGIQVLPMIHPAGSANGARSAYPDHDRRSKELLRDMLAETGINSS